IAARYDQLHDDAFAREELTRLLTAVEGVQLSVADDYGTPAIDAADLLVTYIAQTPPGGAEVAKLEAFLERGGRWFAIHTSNAVPPDCPLPRVIGSRFLTHPPYGPFQVEVTQPDTSLLEGIEPFDVEDELYVIEQADDLDVLLHARWGGEVRGLRVDEADQPLMYRRRVGAGEVLYLALGHCNPAGIVVQGVEVGQRRGSWQSRVFRELVRRGVEWAARGEETR
ncbi:MAG: ThuA domain-containing protein, partial [Dehalococcoidia bacterium]